MAFNLAPIMLSGVSWLCCTVQLRVLLFFLDICIMFLSGPMFFFFRISNIEILRNIPNYVIVPCSNQVMLIYFFTYIPRNIFFYLTFFCLFADPEYRRQFGSNLISSSWPRSSPYLVRTPSGTSIRCFDFPKI